MNLRLINLPRLIENTFQQLPASQQLEFLHFQAHSLLQEAVNLNVLNRKSKFILFNHNTNLRFLSVSQHAISRLSKLHKLLNNFLDIPNKLELKDVRYFNNFMKSLLNVYHIIQNRLQLINSTRIYHIQLKAFQPDHYINIPQILKFVEDIKDIPGISNLVIHGSISTHDFTKFSDIDTFLIIDEIAQENEDILFECIHRLYYASKWFYKFDPFQHHRYFLCLQTDLNIYNQSFLPVEVFKYATVLRGKNTIVFKTYNSLLSHIICFHNLLKGLLDELSIFSQRMSTTTWRFKYFLGLIYLVPVFFLETKGIYVYKRESFVIIRDWLDNYLIEFLDRCSELRQEWDYNILMREKLLRYLILDLVPNPMFYEYLEKHLSNKIDLRDKTWLLEGTKRLCEFFYKKLEELLKEVNICLI